MRTLIAVLITILLIGCSRQLPVKRTGSEIQLKTTDGATVFADFYSTKTPEGIILMFHQAGSSALEYAPIAPEMNKRGYDGLAVDLSSGGDMYGPNRTVDLNKKSTDYLGSYPGMEAALKWALDKKYKHILVLGSSYSASLSLKLAADHSEINGLILFSPGEYLDQKGIVKQWSKSVKCPMLIVCGKGETGQSEEIMNAAGNASSKTLISDPEYIHGASTLRPEKKVPHIDRIWTAIDRFLSSNKDR